MSCISEITPLHEVPGRIRYFVPQIKASTANATALRAYMVRVPGVYHARACPQLGTFLIYFDGSELSRDALSGHIHACPLPEKVIARHEPPAAPEVKRRRTPPRPAVVSPAPRTLLVELARHGLAAAGGGSGGLGLGVTALRTLLAVARRAH